MNDSGTLCEEMNETPTSGEVCEAVCEAAPPSRRNILGAAAGAVAGILPFFLFPKKSEAMPFCRAVCQPAEEGTCCEGCDEAGCQDHCQICCIAGHEPGNCGDNCQDSCMTSCQDPCLGACQNCQDACETSCQQPCMVGCQDYCETHCQEFCEVFCEAPGQC